MGNEHGKSTRKKKGKDEAGAAPGAAPGAAAAGGSNWPTEVAPTPPLRARIASDTPVDRRTVIPPRPPGLNRALSRGTPDNSPKLGRNKPLHQYDYVEPISIVKERRRRDLDEDMMLDTWRPLIEFSEEEKARLLKRLVQQPMYAEEEVPYYNVLLFGMVSHGKTSVVNSIASAVIGQVTSLVPAGSSGGGTGASVTRQYRRHKFRKTFKDKEIVRVRYFDTMGVEATAGIPEADLVHILNGNIKSGYVFDEEGTIDPKSEHYEQNPKLADCIHAVAAVVDGNALDLIGGRALEKIHTYKNIVNKRGVPFCVLMTKVDLIFPYIATDTQDAYKMYFSRTVKEAVDKCSRIFGVPTNQVFPLKNYESEMDNVPAYDILSLTTCLKLMHMAEGYVRTRLDDD